MSFAIMRIGKIHSMASVKGAERHGLERERLPDRKHAERVCENKFICCNKEYAGLSLSECVEKRLEGLTPRSNSVRCLEFIMTFSPEAEPYVGPQRVEWIAANLRWLSDNFGGRENIVQGRFDADESTYHCHFYVVPRTSDNRLSARDFVNGKQVLSKLQDSYSVAMREFGLERGMCFVDNPDVPTKKHKSVKKHRAEIKEFEKNNSLEK